VQADLSKPAGPALLVSEVVKQFPSPLQIDIIIHNAGLGGITPIEDTTVEIFEQTYTINVLGPLLLMQAALPYLPHDRSGRIVNLGSVSSTLGFKGQSIYGGTKAALEAMTRTWARELAERATVNSVNPGPVRTEMYAANTDEFKRLIKPFIENAPLMAVREGVDSQQDIEDSKTAGGRPGEPEEIANVVAMLCLPESAWVTGQVVSANGGMIFGLQ
jgi:3-oxoacyl-[acyl-carrier protein] reductase